jgi:hypothetical protein
MKTALILFLLAVVISTGLVFILVPRHLVVTNEKKIAVTRNGFRSCLHDLKIWDQWWPADSAGKFHHQAVDSVFRFGNVSYKLSAALTNGAEIQIEYDNFKTLSRVVIIPGLNDSLTAIWSANLESGFNPISRLKTYFTARKIQNNIDTVFNHLSLFAGKVENVYGFPIIRTTFLDTILIVHKLITTEPPTTAQIYDAINNLKKHIADQHASEKDYPMLNTKIIENGQYETMMAICVDKKIPDTKDYSLVHMVNMKDRFLMTEVTGGPFRIREAHDAILRYMDDRKLSPPGRPFEILVTDRSKELDTLKWKTVIFHPSM